MEWIGQKMGEGGRYTLVQELGAGAMGMVFLADDARLTRRVVIKVLAPMLTGNPRIRERFHNEARIQANLEHPNIVRALDSLEDGGHLAIVMEYAQGSDLEAHIVECGGRVPLRRAFDLLDPVMDAMQFAHSMGVVHRDLKPGNILLDRKTGTEVPKVADFGIAKILGQEGAGRTREGAVIGTPSYMPPEQLRGEQDLDHRADVYALGAILYQLVVGSMPLGEGSEYEITHRALSGVRPVSASTLVPTLPVVFDALIAKAMEGDRNLRYGSVAELRQDLRDLIEGREPRSLAVSRAPEPRRAGVSAPTVFEGDLPGAPGAAGAPPRPPSAPTVFESPTEAGGAPAATPSVPGMPAFSGAGGTVPPLPQPAAEGGGQPSTGAGTAADTGVRAPSRSFRTQVLVGAVAIACLMAVALAMTLGDKSDSMEAGGAVSARAGDDESAANHGGGGGNTTREADPALDDLLGQGGGGTTTSENASATGHAAGGQGGSTASTGEVSPTPTPAVASAEQIAAVGAGTDGPDQPGAGSASGSAAVPPPTPAVVVEPPTPVTPTTMPRAPWSRGNYWVYQRERSGSGRSGDECSAERYYVKRWVDDVQDEYGILMVTMKERGGPSDTKERVIRYAVDDRCVRQVLTSGIHVDLYCLSDRALARQTVSGMLFSTQESSFVGCIDCPWGGSYGAMFDPWVGRLRFTSYDEHGRRSVEELVGYRVGSASAGEHELEPLICDYDQSHKLRANRPLQFPLSRREGFSTLKAVTNPHGSSVELVRNQGGVETIHSGLTLARAKSWALPGESELVLLQYDGGGYEQFLVLRLRSGSITSRDTLTYRKPSKRGLDALLLSDGNQCFLRARHRSGPTSCQAADYSLQGSWLRRTGGTLSN